MAADARPQRIHTRVHTDWSGLISRQGLGGLRSASDLRRLVTRDPLSLVRREESEVELAHEPQGCLARTASRRG